MREPEEVVIAELWERLRAAERVSSREALEVAFEVMSGVSVNSGRGVVYCSV